jgi:serine/threonine protein phosphatase PrpC
MMVEAEPLLAAAAVAAVRSETQQFVQYTVAHMIKPSGQSRVSLCSKGRVAPVTADHEEQQEKEPLANH